MFTEQELTYILRLLRNRNLLLNFKYVEDGDYSGVLQELEVVDKLIAKLERGNEDTSSSLS